MCDLRIYTHLFSVYTTEEVTVMFDESVSLPIAKAASTSSTESCADDEHTTTTKTLGSEGEQGGLKLFPDEWSAITVVAGAFGGSSDLLLASVRHLASITVFYASTYETDYLLVQKSKLNMVMKLFKGLGYKLRDRRCAGAETEYVCEAQAIDADRQNTLPDDAEPPPVGEPRPLENMKLEVEMASIQRANSVSDLAQALPVLIDTMFYMLPDFFAISIIDNEVTIVGETHVLSRLPHECLATSSRYRVVRVGCEQNVGLGYEEAGIVDRYVRSLQDENIPVYYLCTFLTDYVLIDHADFEDAVETWRDHGIPVLPA